MKYLKYFLGVAGIISLGAYLSLFFTQTVAANPANVRTVQSSGASIATTTGLAYVSPKGVSGVATSSLVFTANDLFEKSVGINATASTTGGVLNWTIDTSPNGIDWFAYGVASSTVQGSPRFFYATSTTMYSWNIPVNPATSSLSVIVPDVVANYLRYNFTIENTNAAIWEVVSGRRQIQ